MSEVQSIGTYVEPGIEVPKHAVDLSSLRLDLVANWQRCGQAADCFGRFLSYNYEDSDNAYNTLSTVLNELLENAVKFSIGGEDQVKLSIAYFDDEVVMETANVAHSDSAFKLLEGVTRIENEDLELLFLEQLEHTANNATHASGLGFITIKKDYGARLGVRVEPSQNEENRVRVSVQVILGTESMGATA